MKKSTIVCFLVSILLVSVIITACNPEDFLYDLFCCWFFPPTDDSVGGGPSVKHYEIEFDHQVDYNPFTQQGQVFVQSCIPALCWLDFVTSDTALPNESIHINNLQAHYLQNVERNLWGNANKYPYYLCGIKSLWGYDGIRHYDEVGGVATYLEIDNEFQPVAYVCVEKALQADDYYGPAFVTLHELGHSLFGLTHMCMDDDPSNFNYSDHDPGDRRCIMAPSASPPCGESPIPDLHFCDSCLIRIQRCSPRE